MAGEKPAGNSPANSGSGNSGGNSGGNPGGGNANKAPGKNNRRRSLRSKRRGGAGRKPDEGGSSSSEPRSEPREAREPRPPRDPRPQTNAPSSADKSVRDNRDRRRRRRMRAKQRGPNETAPPVVEDILKDLPPLVPAFVYTHVLRPAMRETFEFRTEHFSKVTRKLDDFHIDLSPLYPDGGNEIKGVAYVDPNAERFDYEGDDEESVYDPNWAEQSDEAALLDGNLDEVGAIADDFYADMNDSVLDDAPEEDIDA